MENNLLITGSSSDVGRSFIEQYGHKFDKIYAQYRTVPPNITSSNVEFVRCDFSIDFELEKLCQFISEKKISHFIHLPATPPQYHRFHEIPLEEVEIDYKVQYRSAFLIIQSLIKSMKSHHRGKIVFMLSKYVTMDVPPKFISSYIVTKYALLGLVKTLSAEYSGYGININAISPSMIATKFINNLPEYIIQQEAELSNRKTLLHTEDVIPTIDYLLSDASNSICGQNIIISNGN